MKKRNNAHCIHLDLSNVFAYASKNIYKQICGEAIGTWFPRQFFPTFTDKTSRKPLSPSDIKGRAVLSGFYGCNMQLPFHIFQKPARRNILHLHHFKNMSKAFIASIFQIHCQLIFWCDLSQGSISQRFLNALSRLAVTI